MVTGASSGFGLATAWRFAELGRGAAPGSRLPRGARRRRVVPQVQARARRAARGAAQGPRRGDRRQVPRRGAGAASPRPRRRARTRLRRRRQVPLLPPGHDGHPQGRGRGDAPARGLRRGRHPRQQRGPRARQGHGGRERDGGRRAHDDDERERPHRLHGDLRQGHEEARPRPRHQRRLRVRPRGLRRRLGLLRVQARSRGVALLGGARRAATRPGAGTR